MLDVQYNIPLPPPPGGPGASTSASADASANASAGSSAVACPGPFAGPSTSATSAGPSTSATSADISAGASKLAKVCSRHVNQISPARLLALQASLKTMSNLLFGGGCALAENQWSFCLDYV